MPHVIKDFLGVFLMARSSVQFSTCQKKGEVCTISRLGWYSHQQGNTKLKAFQTWHSSCESQWERNTHSHTHRERESAWGFDMCNMEAVSVANTSFALDLFSEIRASNKINNIFYSPLSISTALTMVSLGAAGNTATQMSKVRRKKWHDWYM